jgi:hypothetical protein
VAEEMVRSWINAALRPIGLHLPYGGVICAEMTKRIVVEDDWRARILTQRTLVFTSAPAAGDLRDTYAIVPGAPEEVLLYDSPDGQEVGRRRVNAQTLVVDWLPRRPVTRYALYRHEDAWTAPESYRKAALSAQYTCDMKTGAFSIEFLSPSSFEAGVLFRAPRMRRFRSERGLVKYALAQLNAPDAQKPHLHDQGHRAMWHIEGPRIGDRFLFVLFHEHGIADWEERINATSLAGRARKLFQGVAHSLGR